ncbi:MAG: fructose-bisphosphate aldolase [Candidatus Eremiobacteraeota bacterium]|nr:fructose-bisphosphate aldolase [Candidatus Eremiobacteraeota bacterium]
MQTDFRTVAHDLVCTGAGILAIDESSGTCNARFAKLGIEQTEEQRRAYRELLITAPGVGEFVSGMILYDETIRQSTQGGVRFVDALRARGIAVGIKVDSGTTLLPRTADETITEGLDGLRKRLAEYRTMGATFAKWRAVFRITADTPSTRAIRANAHALARYAALCQESGIVPIVEPEVLADGDHSLERCADVTRAVLRSVFSELEEQGVFFEGIVLKPSMVLAGFANAQQPALGETVAATLAVLRGTVPMAVPGIAFLSGGQDDRAATQLLGALNVASPDAPWALTFSYGRAIQRPALEHWRGNPERVREAQRILLQRAYQNALAARGAYDPANEERLLVGAAS